MEVDTKENEYEKRVEFIESDKLKTIDERIKEDPSNSDLYIEKGLELRKTRHFKEAIYTYSIGLTYDPFNCLLYRHRGHAYVNIGRYEEAAADFLMGTRLNPNNWDCWYHLGLSYHLLGDFKRAKQAYEACWQISYDGDSKIACADWHYMTCLKLGLKQEAFKYVNQIDKDIEFDDDFSGAYYRRVMSYKKVLDPEKVLEDALKKDDHVFATSTYGLAVTYEANGDLDKAMEIYHLIEEKDKLWPGFAEHATHQRLHVWEKKGVL